MTVSERVSVESNLMDEVGMTAHDIERRQQLVGLSRDDLPRIASIRAIVHDGAEELTTVFFESMKGIEEARGLISNRQFSEKVRALKVAHLRAMVEGVYQRDYVEQRVRLGLLYSRAGLEPRVFLGAFHALLREIGLRVMRAGVTNPIEAFEAFMALKKIAFLDIGVIVDVLAFERERVIRQQAEAIRELSTPVLQIRERMLLLPIIGVIDTHRARLITESLLTAIRANRAKIVVMDITGVLTIDSKVANHLIQTVAASRLMGADVIVTGLSSGVAQSLVALGIELDSLNTVGDLQGGVDEAERRLGYRVSREEPGATSCSPQLRS